MTMIAKMNNRCLLLVPVMFVALGANAQDRTSDPLGPMTQCINRDGFHYQQKNRRPAAAKSREIDTSAGPLRVSTADGYRLMVHRTSSSPLVNLKIERSAEGRFASDREAIVTQLKDMAARTKPPYQINLETSTLNGIEVLALNRPIENASGVISIYTLMHAGSGTVATAYLLNQRAETREYSNDAEFAALRDRFIGLLSECMGIPDNA